MGTRGPPANIVKYFVHCNYSKTLSRRIIYGLFSHPVVGFWGLPPQTATVAASSNPYFANPWKNSCGRLCLYSQLLQKRQKGRQSAVYAHKQKYYW